MRRGKSETSEKSSLGVLDKIDKNVGKGKVRKMTEVYFQSLFGR